MPLVCRTEENQEAHRINEQMSAEIGELKADVGQLKVKLGARRDSEYQKVLDALSRQQDDGGTDGLSLHLAQQIKQLANQLEQVEHEKVETERQLARYAREHSSALARCQGGMEELQTRLDEAHAEIASLKGSRDAGAGAAAATTTPRRSLSHSRGNGSSGRLTTASGQGYASSFDNMEFGSSASESGDSLISSSSGATSTAVSDRFSDSGGSGWRLWPGGSVGSFVSVISAYQQTGPRPAERNEDSPS